MHFNDFVGAGVEAEDLIYEKSSVFDQKVKNFVQVLLQNFVFQVSRESTRVC